MAHNFNFKYILSLLTTGVLLIGGVCRPALAQERKIGPAPWYVGLTVDAVMQPQTPLVSVQEESNYRGLTMDGTIGHPLKNKLGLLKREVNMDSTGSYIEFTEKLGEFNHKLPTVLTREQYVEYRRQHYL